MTRKGGASLQVLDFARLIYHQDLGRYCHIREVFSGIAIQCFSDGELCTLIQYQDGLAHGVSAAWHPNGQIELYNETSQGVRDGKYIEWAADGVKLIDEQYRSGRLISRGDKRQMPDVKNRIK